MEHQGHATAGVDEYGNPVAGHVTTGTHGATGGEQMQPMRDDHKTDGVLRRSGSSSSSSSSEDDGMGGRRKKGIKEKIKEKLPGGNKDHQQHATATGGTHNAGVTGTGAHGTADGTGEKKHATATGGTHNAGVTGTGAHGTADGTGEKKHATATGGTHNAGVTGTGAHGTADGTGEKKGVMDKIKEKLPGKH